MPNGKIGDHPITDILVHKRPVYGDEADNLIRKIAELCSHRELSEWWEREIGWHANGEFALRKARLRVDELLNRARESGWETR
jgi:hypothetical protein